MVVFFCQAEDGIRDLVRSRGLGDVYKRQPIIPRMEINRGTSFDLYKRKPVKNVLGPNAIFGPCLLYTSDAADERSSVDLGGRRIIKKKTKLSEVRCDACHIKKRSRQIS